MKNILIFMKKECHAQNASMRKLMNKKKDLE